MRTAVVLFTRDLRVRDHPGLTAAVREAERVIPLFVLDDAILASSFAAPNRMRFLLDALADLRRALGGGLIVRRGDVVRETLELEPDAVFLSRDVSAYAQERERRLAERVPTRSFPGITVVPPGDVAPAGGDHFRVFTPFWRAWEKTSWRAPLRAPRRVPVPPTIPPGRLPALRDLVRGDPSPELPAGGEHEGFRRMARWLARDLSSYDERRDDLAADATSRLGAYLHLGCISPLELAVRARGGRGGASFVRQLAWRDFFHQLLASNPDTSQADFRPRDDRWRRDRRALRAWKEGRTGYPVIDAGMRQLAREGWMPGRARLLAASFLTKHLYLDWRHGARHFFDCSWTATSPATSATGNGWPGREPTRARTGCSTRCCRRSATTRRERTSGATCPSSPAWTRR